MRLTTALARATNKPEAGAAGVPLKLTPVVQDPAEPWRSAQDYTHIINEVDLGYVSKSVRVPIELLDEMQQSVEIWRTYRDYTLVMARIKKLREGLHETSE